LLFEPVPKQAEPDKSMWLKDGDVKKCPDTGAVFGVLWNRRHHCRATGLIYMDEKCADKVVLPDVGWYEPQRVRQ
jgi:myosin-1